MTFQEEKERFEANHRHQDGTLLTFHGVNGFDVYNCSIPFTWEGQRYLFGRVERREEWARSWVRLFRETGPDTYTLVPDSMIYTLEDPFVTRIGAELVLGGTSVQKVAGAVSTYFGYFFRGTRLEDLHYFTTGPAYMKDIRLVPLGNRIGVFSRPRSPEIEKKYGSGAVVGFTVIDDLNQLTDSVVENAPVVDGLFGPGEWGGCNQCYPLSSGKVGVIGHRCFRYEDAAGIQQMCYAVISFVLDPDTRLVLEQKIIATRSCFPDTPAKKDNLQDCAFPSGIVPREAGLVDLYSGLSDVGEGRVRMENPFAGFGDILPLF